MNLAGAHVLVLEDEPIIGLALHDQLSERGAIVHYAERIEEAAALLETKVVDCAILDVNVHGKPSYEIARRLKDSSTPFVFATGYGDRSHPAEFEGTPTLSKPYSVDEIARALS